MRDKNNSKCIIQSSNLNEELGQIDYIFSDKTGTLTCNQMVFKKLIVGSKIYPREIFKKTISKYDTIFKKINNQKQQYVDFNDPVFVVDYKKDQNSFDCVKLLGLCHSVTLNAKKEYQADSPDELALLNFAKFCNFEFINRNEDNVLDINDHGNIKNYTVLKIIEFTSDRKMMSVIIKDHKGKITLYSKGADNVIFSRSKRKMSNGEDIIDLKQKINKFAGEGLRTLILAKKELTKNDFNVFSKNYTKALNNLKNRDQSVKKVEEEMESDLTVIGATAIEDKLQDRVSECIQNFLEAGIKMWVLTGDKVETAVNIGYSCNLLKKEFNLFKLLSFNKEVIEKQLDGYFKTIKNNPNLIFALVVSGDALISIKRNRRLTKKFTKIILKAKSVLCCRVSPKQKAQIVHLVKHALPDARTLGIGDGANDVNMIVAANVGVGIKGLEGQQAARSSDYVIGEFKLLERLLFIYGREFYRKNSYLILYNFWKNVVLVLPQFFYALMFNNFSGVTLYEGYLYQFVNVFYTFIPIIIYAVFDHELEEDDLLNNPKYYQVGLKRIHFNPANFLVWYFTGIVQAFFICMFCAFTEFAPQYDGSYFGFWGFGIMVFFQTQLISNLKIFIISNSFNFWIFFFTFGSFFLFLISFIVVSHITTNSHYGLFGDII